MDASGNMPLLWSGWRSKWEWERRPPGLDDNSPCDFCIHIGVPGGDDLCRDKVGAC